MMTGSMRRLLVPALLLSAGALPAQGIWDSSARFAPSFYSYEIKAPFNEKVSEFALPFFFVVPVTSALSMDIGTAFASASLEQTSIDSVGNQKKSTSQMSGLTDTQLRANYTFGPDFFVLTAGADIPTC